MKYLKMLGLAAFAAMAFTAFVGASTASATTLEVTGVTQNGPVTITASLKAETSAILEDQFGFIENTCKESHVHGETTVYTGTKVTGPLTDKEKGLSFGGCDYTVTVHNAGKLYVEWTSGTNGRVFSEEAEVTSYSPIHGTHINCKTGAGTPLGTITGVKHGQAQMDINATLNCGPHTSSAKWTATYTVTTEGIGVSQ